MISKSTSNCVPCNGVFIVIFFKTMYDKIIVRFGDLRNNKVSVLPCVVKRYTCFIPPNPFPGIRKILDLIQLSTVLFLCESIHQSSL